MWYLEKLSTYFPLHLCKCVLFQCQFISQSKTLLIASSLWLAEGQTSLSCSITLIGSCATIRWASCEQKKQNQRDRRCVTLRGPMAMLQGVCQLSLGLNICKIIIIKKKLINKWIKNICQNLNISNIHRQLFSTRGLKKLPRGLI